MGRIEKGRGEDKESPWGRNMREDYIDSGQGACRSLPAHRLGSESSVYFLVEKGKSHL